MQGIRETKLEAGKIHKSKAGEGSKKDKEGTEEEDSSKDSARTLLEVDEEADIPHKPLFEFFHKNRSTVKNSNYLSF